MKGNDSTVELSKVKQNTQKHTDKSCNLKKVEDKLNQAVLTVFVKCPIEEVAHQQYADVVKWMGGDERKMVYDSDQEKGDQKQIFNLSKKVMLLINQWGTH